MSGFIPDLSHLPHWLFTAIDVGLVLVLTYLLLLIIGERRTLWMVQGFIFLMLASVLSDWLKLKLLAFVLDKLVLGSAEIGRAHV